MTRILVDSCAWVEYFKGSKNGKKFARIIESEKNQCFYSNIILAEVTSKFKRESENVKNAIEGMRNTAHPVYEKEIDYINGGLIHAREKENKKELSIADAIIIAISERNLLKILTQDFHFKNLENVLFVKK